MTQPVFLHIDLNRGLMERLSRVSTLHGRGKGTEAGRLITAVIIALQDPRLEGHMPPVSPVTVEEPFDCELRVKLLQPIKEVFGFLSIEEEKSRARFCREFLHVGLSVVESMDEDPLYGRLVELTVRKLITNRETTLCHMKG